VLGVRMGFRCNRRNPWARRASPVSSIAARPERGLRFRRAVGGSRAKRITTVEPGRFSASATSVNARSSSGASLPSSARVALHELDQMPGGGPARGSETFTPGNPPARTSTLDDELVGAAGAVFGKGVRKTIPKAPSSRRAVIRKCFCGPGRVSAVGLDEGVALEAFGRRRVQPCPHVLSGQTSPVRASKLVAQLQPVLRSLAQASASQGMGGRSPRKFLGTYAV